MSATVSDPFLLSSYAFPKRPSKQLDNGGSSQSVYASYQASTNKSDGYVTVAAHGDGVHVLDLSTLHPAISHTLEPSTSFSCPAVTRTTHVDGVQTCTTFAAIEYSPDVPTGESGRTVWAWKEILSGGVMSSSPPNKKRSTVISNRIAQIYAPDELPEKLLLVSPNGMMYVMDEQLVELSSTHSSESQEGEHTLLKDFVLPRSLCSFVPTRTASSYGVIAVLCTKHGDAVHVAVRSVDPDGRLISLGNLQIYLQETDIVDVSCSPSGHLSILTRTGSWHSFQLESLDSTSLSLTTLSNPIRLRSLTAIAPPNIPGGSPTANELSIVSIGSSHVLLAGITSGASPELALLIWDLQYAVLLAAHTGPVPSSLARTKKTGITLRLTAAPQNALLILIPNFSSPTQQDSAAARASLLAVPFSVPATSTVAHAVGRASAGVRWVVPEQTAASAEMSDAQYKVMKTMRAAMEQKRVEGADDAFFGWVKLEESRRSQNGTDPLDIPALGYAFVKQTLDVVLRQPKGAGADIPYSPKVLRYLLEKRAVSDAMVENGLFSVLRLRGDWQTIILVLKTVIDIPEAEIISALHFIIVAHRKHSLRGPPADEDAMQVDASSNADLPTLPVFLSACVSYPTSAAPLRLAIRKYLSDAEELVSVLEVLDHWIEQWNNKALQLLPQNGPRDQDSTLVPVVVEDNEGGLPPLTKLLLFLQNLLDASFLTFLSHPQSHGLLQTIFAHLQIETAFTEAVEQLRGPLQPFAAAHAKAHVEAAQTTQKTDTKVDWRRRKKAAHEQASLALGLYQVEELVI